MASLLDWLGGIGKKIHGVEAQLNPFDNGENYQSVVNGAPRYQVPQQRPQTPQQQRPLVNGGFKTGLDALQTPMAQPVKPKIDISTNAQLSQKQQPKQPDPLKAVGNFVNNNILKPTAEDVSKAYNTVAVPITGLTGAAMVGADNIFNGGRNADNLAAATKAAVAENVKNSFVPANIASGQATPIQFATEIAKTGIKLAPYAINPAAGGVIDKLGATVADRVGSKVVGGLAKNTAGAAVTAPTFAALNAAQQGLDSGFRSFDPRQSVQTGLGAGAMALGGGVLNDTLHGTVKAGINRTNEIVNAPGYNPENGSIKNPFSRENPSSPSGPGAYKEAQAPKVPTRSQVKALQRKESGTPTLREVSPPAPSLGNRPAYNPDYTAFDPSEYVSNQVKAQNAARKAGNQPILSKAKNEIKAKLIDSFAPIEDTLNKAVKQGAEVATKDNIKYQIDRALRADTIAGQYARDNGIVNTIKSVPNTKEFEQYLIATHAKELESNGVKTGRNSRNDQMLVDALAPRYEPHAQAIAKYSQNLLDKSVEYGLIDKSLASQLKKQYPNYVPFNRIFGDNEIQGFKGAGSGKASVSSQSVVKKIKGSERAVESPLSSLLKKTQDVIEQGERNKAASILASYKDLPGNPFNLKELKPSETIGNRSTISYLDKGKKRTFETTPEIAAAAKSLNKEQLGLIGKILAIPTRALRLGATGLNPAFTLANVAKDFGTAFINSDHPFRIADPEVFKSALAAAVYHKGKSYSELVREGAGGTSLDIARGKEPVNIKKIRAERNIATKALYTVTRPSELLRAAENTIGRSEEFGRALQYYSNKKAALKSGASASEARIIGANAARNNTVNFARAGDYGRVLNSVLPYLNAGIQGSRTFVRNVKDKPVRTLSKMVISAFTPVAATTVWNMSDPERRKAYDNISDYEKQNNIIIVPPHPQQDSEGRWNVIKIPLSQEVANLSNIVRGGVEKSLGGQGNTAPEVAGNLIGAGTSLNVENPRQLIGQVTPQAVKPALETLLNQNLFTGQQIVPDAIKNLDPKDQKNKSTSGTATVLGGILGMSPLQVDNAIKTSTGGLGQNVINVSDSVLARGGVIKPNQVSGKSFIDSIANRFNSAQGTTPGGLYFKTIQDVSKAHKLAGKEYEQLNSILAKEVDPSGNPLPTDEKTKMTNNLILANSPNIAAVRAEAAKKLSQITGNPVDPLYNLTPKQQEQYYRMQASPRGGQDYKDIQNKNAGWLPAFQQERSAFFAANPIPKTGTSGTVPYPEDSPQVAALLDKYSTLTGADRTQFMKDHPEISKSFDAKARYTNAVRQAEGYTPLRVYQQASPRVQAILDSLPQGTDKASKKARALAYNDPEVATWMQNNSMYQLTKDAAVAQLQGNDLTQSGLKAVNSIGNYDLVRNPDGTLALKYGNGGGGSGVSGVQPGAVDLSGYGSSKKGKGRRKGKKAKFTSKTRVPKTLLKGSKTFGNAVQSASYKKQPLKKYKTNAPEAPKGVKTKVKRGVMYRNLV